MANLDYEEMRRIYRLEKSTTRLVDVPEDFFHLLHFFIQDERAKYLDSLKDLNATKAKDFGNLKKLVEEWFSVREKKLLNTVLISARTNDHDDEHMAQPEKELYGILLSALQTHRKLVNEVLDANGMSIEPPASKVKAEEETKTSETQTKRESEVETPPISRETVSKPASTEKSNQRITILAEVPSFVGTDMKEYGPYKEGEVVELPSKIAELFISRKLGE